MQLLSEDVAAIVQEVWSSMLGLEIEPVDLNAEDVGQAIAGSVSITGASDCIVALEMDMSTAQTVGATMFMMDADELSPNDLADAVGELTNMIGGNVKSLLPEPSSLSLPVVAKGEHPTLNVVGGEKLLSQVFLCCEGKVLVSIWSRE